MAIGDILQVNPVGLLHGQTVINTFFYRIDAVGAGDARDNLINGWQADVEAAYIGCLSNEYTLSKYEAFGVTPVLPKIEEGDGVTTGTVVQDSLPSSVAGIIRRKTLLPGRKGRGRVYLPAVPATFETDSRLATVGFNAYTTLATALVPTIIVGGWSFTPIHVSRDPTTAIAIDRWVVHDILRNQRRRQVGVGI